MNPVGQKETAFASTTVSYTHLDVYKRQITDAVLGVESISIARLFGWEGEMLQGLAAGQEFCGAATEFLQQPSYGDGGMAAAVRIASALPARF